MDDKKKYYYNCPYKAAYMARHFGMDFEGCRDGTCFEAALHSDADPDIYDTEGDKFYIHPDSLHLLEPQEGDLVKVVCCEADCEYPEDWVIGVIEGDVCTVRCNLQGTSGYSISLNRVSAKEIIQRNGKAFIWPEVE